jgi:hypothetical protein
MATVVFRQIKIRPALRLRVSKDEEVNMSETIGEKEKITILLHEYDTLREEIIQRTNHGFQIYGIGAVFFVWLMSRSFDQRFWIMLCISVIALGRAWRSSVREIRKAAERLQELENIINGLAGTDLLVWESHKSGFATGSKWFWGTRKTKKQASANISETEPKLPNDGASQ